MLKVVFLGTNGWYDSPTGNTICILVQTRDYDIILDAGNGLWKLDQYRNPDRPAFLFISHFHLDHTAGLHVITKHRFHQGLTFLVHEGGTKYLNQLVAFPFTMPFADMPFQTSILEVPRQSGELPFKAELLPMLHTAPTLGMRMELEGKVIAYCPDTGYCENTVSLGRNADLLITECAYVPGEETPHWPHLNPETAARIAVEAKANQLGLVHFDAARYTKPAMRDMAAMEARKIFGNTFAATDGMELEL